MPEFREVRTTIDTIEGAQKIADALVEKRVAACVQVSGPITSTYWWKGQVERAQEWVCVVKTRKDLYNSAETTICQLHSYDEPEIIATAIIEGSQGYLRWIEKETQKHSYRGILPCFFGGFVSRLFFSISRALMSLIRVRRGSITSSI